MYNLFKKLLFSCGYNFDLIKTVSDEKYSIGIACGDKFVSLMHTHLCSSICRIHQYTLKQNAFCVIRSVSEDSVFTYPL